jgi:alanine racemase
MYDQPKTMKKITIKDIAARAGVSKTSVSFALNNPSRISKKTYENIMSIVNEFGYVPDPVARTLTTKRLGALGLLLPQPISEAMDNPHLCEVISGLGEECERNEISLTMLPPVRGTIIEAARRAFVDALVTIGVGPDHEVIDMLRHRHIPFVTIDGEETGTTMNVGISDENAAYVLMKYILGLGHRRIAILSVKPNSILSVENDKSIVLEKRLSGFSRAFGEVGLSLQNDRIWIIPAEGSRKGGLEAGKSVLSLDNLPTAIVAMADIIALGVYDAAKQLGIEIPGRLSVTGFDDIYESGFASPPLTTIHQPAREKGVQAAVLAIGMLNGSPVHHCRFDFELVVRDSCASPSKI